MTAIIEPEELLIEVAACVHALRVNPLPRADKKVLLAYVDDLLEPYRPDDENGSA